MRRRTPRVCLVSPAHVWVNPRLVKEADALSAAGYDVVVGYRADARWGCERDDALLAGKPWAWTRFDCTRESGRPWLTAALRQKAALHAVRRGLTSDRLDAEAYCRAYPRMVRWAAAQEADLYIAHTQPALPIAAEAARRTGAAYAFDCEDLLAEEVSDGGLAPWRRALIERIEARWLPSAAYASATSRPMKEYLERRYALANVPYWHNSFPLHETAAIAPPDRRPRDETRRLAWMSATIGPHRGLEDIFAALALDAGAWELRLFGNLPEEQRWWMDGLRRALPERARVVIQPLPRPADVMPALAACDVGLATDPNDCLNRSLTVCNKVCLYLQAGLAVLASNTPGQASVVDGPRRVGLLYEPGDAEGAAAALRRLRDEETLRAMQREAWDAGQRTYNWDVEGRVFLAAVEGALGGGPPASRAFEAVPQRA